MRNLFKQAALMSRRQPEFVLLGDWSYQLPVPQQAQPQGSNSNNRIVMPSQPALLFSPIIQAPRSRRQQAGPVPWIEANIDLHDQVMADGVYVTFTDPRALCGKPAKCEPAVVLMQDRDMDVPCQAYSRWWHDRCSLRSPLP